jgi:glycogen debranching enzyme
MIRMDFNINDKDSLITKIKTIFEGNLRKGHAKWAKTNFRFIAPASKEYVYQWLWDTAFHAIVLSHFDTKWAQNEIRNFLKAQWTDGFLPHIVFWEGNTANLPHWAFIESKLSLRPHTTSITQPSAFPLAVEIIYKKDNDKEFLKEVLPKLARHHRWLLEHRDPDNDHLLAIISPNESGMDELPVFQYAVGFLGSDTARMHYYYRRGDLLNQLYKFNNKTILQKDHFNVEELMFNTVFIEANYSLSRLFKEIGDDNESAYFEQLAKKGEQSLLTKCWDEKEHIFYSLFSKHEKMAKVKSVASLAPLFLSGLKGTQLTQLIEEHLLNPKEFWTDYPVPSVAKSEPYYVPTDTPAYKVKLLWRGPTWVNTNWFVIKGLRKHGYDEIADQIVDKMKDMVQEHGFREYYNPETGEGYRRENFGWSTLMLDLI